MPRARLEEVHAHKKLRKWLDKCGIGTAGLARLLGVNHSQAWRWVHENARPEVPQRMLLEIWARIPMRSWLTKPEHREVKAGVRRIRAFEEAA